MNVENKDMDIGGMIRNARISKGLSQRELSKKLNIAQTTLSHYEVNRRDVPNHLLPRLCKILDKDANYFFFGNTVTGGEKGDTPDKAILRKEIDKLTTDETRILLTTARQFNSGKAAEQKRTTGSGIRNKDADNKNGKAG